MKAKDFDKKFDDNKQDIIDDLDLSTIKRPNQSQKRVNVDFPSWVIDSLDREASRVGVTRQSIIKLWLVERLEEKAANKQLTLTIVIRCAFSFKTRPLRIEFAEALYHVTSRGDTWDRMNLSMK